MSKGNIISGFFNRGGKKGSIKAMETLLNKEAKAAGKEAIEELGEQASKNAEKAASRMAEETASINGRLASGEITEQEANNLLADLRKNAAEESKINNITNKAHGKSGKLNDDFVGKATTAEDQYMKEGVEEFNKKNNKRINEAAQNAYDATLENADPRQKGYSRNEMNNLESDRQRYARSYADERMGDAKKQSKDFNKSIEQLGRDSYGEKVDGKWVNKGEELSDVEAMNRGFDRFNSMDKRRQMAFIHNNFGDEIQGAVSSDKAMKKLQRSYQAGIIKRYAAVGGAGAGIVGAGVGAIPGRTEDDKKAGAVTGAAVAGTVGATSLGILGIARAMARGGR